MDNRTLMKLVLVFVAMVFNTVAFGQNPNRQFKSIESINAGVQVSVSDGVYIFRTYGPNIIETTFIPNGQKHEANSHAVVTQPDNNPFTWAASSNQFIPPHIFIYSKSAKSKGINPSIIVQTNPFQISYFYKGKYLLSERWGYDVDSTMEKIQFNLSEGEKLFGTGNRVLGMDRRGYRLPLYNRAHYGYETHSEQMNFSMPLVISDRLYALHFDNSYTGFLDLDSKKDSSLTYEMTGGRKTYQVIAASDYKELVSAYTSLTGRQPMPPRWAFGNFASRFGYHSEQEARAVVSKFRADSIPLDAIVFDLYWFGKDIQGTLGNFAFYTDSFPTPQKMINDFSNQNVNTVLITEPFILTTSNRWQEAKDKKLLAVDSLDNPFTYDFYFGNTGLIDIYAPHAKKWFWDIYTELANMGVKGFWGDLGEPEVHPSKLLHANGVSADQVHNIYGHDWARLIYEGYKTTFPLERPFILMRAGYSGSQRFGMIPWTGDVNRTWGGLKPQMELTMQMGMQGIAYMHSDLGGFAGANDDPELYVRWLQYGVFQPIFRPHAQQEVASEAIFKDKKTKQLAKEAIELRYQLLPYNYTLAFENHLNGTPLMRPIFMENTQASWADTITNEFMWGPSLLVKPITNPILKNTLPLQDVRAPKGTWYDLRSGKQRIENYQPNQTNQHEAHYLMPGDLSGIPVLVKGGAFIPMSPTIQSTKEYADSSVTIHYYDDKDIKTSQGQWYEDDGLTNEAYEKGLYKLLRMTMKQSNRQSTLLFIPEYGKSCSQMSFSFEVCIHSKRIPKKLILNGKKNVPFVVDQKTQTIRLTTHLSDKQSRLKIKW